MVFPMATEYWRTLRACAGVALAVLAAGCSLEPHYVQPSPPIASQWPVSAPAIQAVAGEGQSVTGHDAVPVGVDLGWRDFFVDPHLQALIAQALANNRDLRVAVLNVAKARAQYRIKRADQVPSVALNASYTGQELPPAVALNNTSEFERATQVGLAMPAFEVDLFGKVRSLSHAAQQQYFAQQDTQRNAQLTLVAEVANAYLTLASDRQAGKLADDTLKNQLDSFTITRNRYRLGAATELDVAQASTTIESARLDHERYAGDVAQDINALTLLVGSPIDPSLLPQSLDAWVTAARPLPAGLPSELLLRRPDVLAAEHSLQAANANIGAARAAFFPDISLTADAGTASDQLSGLFTPGTSTFAFMPQVSIPIFQGGRLRATLAASHADRDIAVAQYEKAIQSAFREVADGLALSLTLSRELHESEALVQTSKQAYDLSLRRFQAGRDSYLVVLESQRSMYSAEKSLISVRMAEQSNRVNLYKALGGGLLEHSR
jgi:outer membrane protein, multidrug efflux system